MKFTIEVEPEDLAGIMRLAIENAPDLIKLNADIAPQITQALLGAWAEMPEDQRNALTRAMMQSFTTATTTGMENSPEVMQSTISAMMKMNPLLAANPLWAAMAGGGTDNTPE